MGEIKYKFVEGLNAGANGPSGSAVATCGQVLCRRERRTSASAAKTALLHRSPLQGLCVLTFASTAVSYFLNCFSTALTKKSLGTNRGTLTKS